MSYTILKEKCNYCGSCSKDCPSSAINIKSSHINNTLCIGCGHCYAVCPQGAVAYRQNPAGETGFGGSSAELFLSRRSVRKYRDQALTEEQLRDIARIGACTPTASNSRNWELHFISGEKVDAFSREICSSLYKTVSMLDNGIARFFLRFTPLKKYSSKAFVQSFKTRLEKGMKGIKDPLFFKALAVGILDYPESDKRFGDSNTALAAHQMILYAHSLGIESTMIGFAVVALKSAKLRKKLGLDKKRTIGQIFTLGYPDVEYLRPAPREMIVKESTSFLSFRHDHTII